MKKSTIFFAAGAALASWLALASCSKSKDTNTDQLATLGKATISGRATANIIDTAGSSGDENAPSGTIIHAWIDTRELVVSADPTVTYAKKYYTGTVDANGNYTITVDVSRYRSAMVHLEPGEFEYSVMKNTIIGGKDSIYYVRNIFSAPFTYAEVANDVHLYRDFSFN